MNSITKATSQALCRLVLRTKSGPLCMGLRAVFRFRRTVIETRHGPFLVDPFSHFGFFVIRDGDYEPELLSFIESHVSPGDTVIDAGAHEGYFAVIAAQRVGSSGRVIAVEPQSRVLPILQQNIQLNRLDNISVAPYAISDNHGSADLFLEPGFNTGGTGFTHMSRFKFKTESVPTRPLSAILEEFAVRDIALLKMDVEGFEYEIVLGSPDVFRQRLVKTIALELHANHMSKRGKCPDDIGLFLTECGYLLDSSESKNLGTHYATMVYNRSI